MRLVLGAIYYYSVPLLAALGAYAATRGKKAWIRTVAIATAFLVPAAAITALLVRVLQVGDR